MKNELDDELIQRYMLGDMPPDERAKFRVRLQNDAGLRALLEEYSLLVSDLQDLGLSRMPADLWQRRIRPVVEENVERAETFWSRVRRFFHGFIPKAARPAMAVLSFVIVMIAVTIFLQQQMLSIDQEPYARALQSIEKLRNEYVTQLNVLMNEANQHMKEMSPELRQAFALGLARIDDAIADAERIYAVYSDDEEAINGLVLAYNGKTEFLRKWLKQDINSGMQ